MDAAWVTTNLLDMRRKPDHSSERVNQALFGEPVRILSEKRGFYRLQKQDGYIGWSDIRMLQTISERRLKQWKHCVNRVVGSGTTAIYSIDRKIEVNPYFCYYGTKAAMIGTNKSLATVVSPDGASYRMSLSALKRIDSDGVTGGDIVKEAKKFLGVPYLWGGLSPAGYDCSGLVQAVCSRFGISIPRDTKEQQRVGVKINREEIKAGDLLFFDRHVGFAFGKGNIIHSSVGGGGVRINSLSSGWIHYREDLDKSFIEARRIL